MRKSTRLVPEHSFRVKQNIIQAITRDSPQGLRRLVPGHTCHLKSASIAKHTTKKSLSPTPSIAHKAASPFGLISHKVGTPFTVIAHRCSMVGRVAGVIGGVPVAYFTTFVPAVLCIVLHPSNTAGLTVVVITKGLLHSHSRFLQGARIVAAAVLARGRWLAQNTFRLNRIFAPLGTTIEGHNHNFFYPTLIPPTLVRTRTQLRPVLAGSVGMIHRELLGRLGLHTLSLIDMAHVHVMRIWTPGLTTFHHFM